MASDKKRSRIRIIVRRGALRRFDRLKRDTEGLPVQLSWDRRVKERRRESGQVANEQRKGDRRKAAPFTWTTSDFVVVEDSEEEPGQDAA